MLNWIYRKLNFPNVTGALIFVQAAIFILIHLKIIEPITLVLIPELVLQGEFWRVFTFAVFPASLSILWVLFAWYLFFLFGTSLENYWGSGKYNLFLLFGYVISVAASFLALYFDSSGFMLNWFCMTGVFLAFAFYFPNFIIHLFFILPIKIKWLALITWLWYGYVLVTGDISAGLMVLASTGNFVLFLGADVIRKLKGGQRRMAAHAEEVKLSQEAFHTCAVCGITDKTHPHMKFRYCSDCHGSPGYCEDHINDHEHITEYSAQEN